MYFQKTTSDSECNDFIEKLRMAKSIEELDLCFQNMINFYAPGKYSLASIFQSNNNITFFDTNDNYPIEWTDRYKKYQYYTCDPIFNNLYTYNLPFWWDLEKLTDITDMQKKILKEAHDFDIKFGTTFPLLLDMGRLNGFLTILDARVNDSILSYVLPLASTLYLEKRHNFTCNHLVSKLTKKEIEVISYKTKGGHAIKNVASGLGIANSTVAYHIENIKTKLNAKTFEQAAFIYGTYTKYVNNVSDNSYDKSKVIIPLNNVEIKLLD